MNAAEQWMTIGSMVLCGLAMGALFDVYRVAVHRFRVPRWLLPGLDVVYWAGTTLSVFVVLLGANHGEVRLYVFLGLGIGVTSYFGLFSGIVIKIASWVIEALIRTGLFFWQIIRTMIIVPLLWIVRIIARILDILFIVIAATLLWTFRLILKPLGALGRWIWRLLLPVRTRLRPAWEKWKIVYGKLKEIVQLLRRKS
jgi:spore cortex biosynthesis protein YabQ